MKLFAVHFFATLLVGCNCASSVSASAVTSIYDSYDLVELENYVQNIGDSFKNSDYSLILVGEKEKIETDLACTCDAYTYDAVQFLHLEQGEAVYENLPSELQDQVDKVNEFTKLPGHAWNQNNDAQCGWLGLHTLGLLTTEDGVAETLNECGYGLGTWSEIHVYSKSPVLN